MKKRTRRGPIARELIGRKIVGYQARPFPDGRGGVAHKPVIYLDDGSRLAFWAEETEHEPGVRVMRFKL